MHSVYVFDQGAFLHKTCLADIALMRFETFVNRPFMNQEVAFLAKFYTAYVTPKRFQAFMHTPPVVVKVMLPSKRCITEVTCV